MDWYISVLKKFAVFDGRARRKEYWMFTLFNIIAIVLLMIVEGIIGTGGILGFVYMLAVILPSIGVSIRRLHDTNRSGWFLLFVLIPFIGGFIVLYFMILDGTPGANKFGENPKGV
ncbi:DUF805 domain-containing protein [Phragmitibacter flavus]|uniref:DUF805 domain-containing protein n=1 Tax=Phragmitibacter flavus TaxID=2576071 RepID=A0A5R8KBD0_9BACT|nr:DUF805 domain-containing protein [Phragmitibacter flavus]TLD69624.1 DUF805 domain-containing protein [Phragmitibacter flavus]